MLIRHRVVTLEVFIRPFNEALQSPERQVEHTLHHQDRGNCHIGVVKWPITILGMCAVGSCSNS